MKTDEIKTMIDLYIDSELSKEKEILLFTMLSQDGDAREYFKSVNYLKNNFQNNIEEFPSKLDESILKQIEGTHKKHAFVSINKKVLLWASCAAAAFLIFISAFYYNKYEDYKDQLVNLSREVKKQNQDLQLIMNAMPEIEVKGRVYWTKEVIVNANL